MDSQQPISGSDLALGRDHFGLLQSDSELRLTGGSMTYVWVTAINQVWVIAINQVCFSLAVGYGMLTVIASYNRFHRDYLRETLIMTFVNSMTEMLSSIAVFSHLGYLAVGIHVDIKSLTDEGTLMAFVTIPYALSKLNTPPFMCASYFLMIAVAGVTSQRMLLLVIVTSLLDWKPDLRGHKFVTMSFLCLLMFVLSLPIATTKGSVIMDLLFESSGKMVILFHILLENFTIGWVYGADRFLNDIHTMLGFKYCGCFVFGQICRFWWKVCWKFITPSICLCVIIMTFTIKTSHQDHPTWVEVVEWVNIVVCPSVIVFMAAITFMKAPGTLKEKLKASISPTPAWGPVLKKDKQEGQRSAQDERLERRRSGCMVSPINMGRLVSHIYDDVDVSAEHSS